MRTKKAVIRLLAIGSLYCVVFLALVMLQFTKKGNFTLRSGGMLISGRYLLENGVKKTTPEGNALAGGVSVYFGGLEFCLDEDDGDEGFALLNSSGAAQPSQPESMVLSGTSVHFTFSEGTELSFISRYSGGSEELRINCVFASGISSMRIPFKLQRQASGDETEKDQLVISYNESQYQFNRAIRGGDKPALVLKTDSPSISYTAISARKTFNPEDYVITEARSAQTFNDIVNIWKDQIFSWWNRNIQLQLNDDTVIAYIAQAAQRGYYRMAAGLIPSDYRFSQQRTWESSAYIGGMSAAFRSFNTAEREKTNRISRMISEKSSSLLEESHVFEYLFVRGYTKIAADGAAFFRALDPGAVTIDITPGIFEGYLDFAKWSPDTENPFERLVDQACLLISKAVLQDIEQSKVFVFRGKNSDIDTEFNMRLGKAIQLWGEKYKQSGWIEFGRSLILSVIALRDDNGSVPQMLAFSDSELFEESGAGRTSAARLYRVFEMSENFPHAVQISSTQGNVWAWTAASVRGDFIEENVFDISVSFPAGETHYMMVRGIRPFSGIQLYNTNWPTDPQFERYDTSGWIYSAQEQTLILKMKHRVTEEHIRIYYKLADES